MIFCLWVMKIFHILHLLCFKSVKTNGDINSCKPTPLSTTNCGGMGVVVRVVGAGFQLKYKYYIYPSLVDCIPGLRDNLK